MGNVQKILLYGEIPVNSYILEDNGECYIIDPGYEKERVIDYIKDSGLSVKGILLTHAHIDHVGAIDAFDVPVYLHEEEHNILLNDELNGFEFYHRSKPYDIKNIKIVTLKDGDKLPLGDKYIEVIHTPGHTVGGVCYRYNNDLYTGDTLFEGTVGKWTFPTGDLDTLKKSVIKIIETEPEEMKIHPAHGNSSTIGTEKIYNHFYTNWKLEK